jgi:hypothetical protein
VAVSPTFTSTSNVATIIGRLNSPGFADGVGTNAQFKTVLGLALTANNATLYVSSRDAHSIRMVNMATLMVTTLAGSTQGTG